MTIPQAFQAVIVVLSFMTNLLLTENANSAERPPNAFLTGDVFRQELDRPFSASWSKEEFRQMLIQISTSRGISIVLDRRLNPSAEFAVSVGNVSLIEGLAQFAQLADGQLSVPENIVYLGPESATKRLRTLIELRRIDEEKVPEQRRSELQMRKIIEWHELDTPRKILNKIATQFRLKISNIELIPHDLWAAATLPKVTLAEALSVVLVQFDSTYRWNEAGASIELISIPATVAIEKRHRAKQKLSDALALIKEQFPEAVAEISKGDVVVKGTVEDQEAISNLLRGKAANRPPKFDQPNDLRQRLITFKTPGPAPIMAVMKTFEASDVHFEYNPDDLKAAGIDLEQTIELNVNKKSAENFFKELFDPVGLDFRFDRQTVKLTPKPAKKELRTE